MRIQRMVLVCAGKVAVQRLDREAVEHADLRRPETEAVDAGVDHDVAGAPGRDLLPARDLFDRVEAGPSLKLQRRLAVVGPDAVKNDQAGALRQLPERFRLGPGRDEEVAATRLRASASTVSRAPRP